MTFDVDRIYLMDAIRGLKKLAGDSVDLVVTDPPYNIASPRKLTLKKGRIMSTMEAWGHFDQFHPFDYDLFIGQVISECYRVLKPGGAFYMFTAREDAGHFIRQARSRGFTYRNSLVVAKKNPLPSLHKSNWRSGWESCIYLVKDKPKTFNFVSQKECVNVMSYSNAESRSGHPTEKPLSAIKRLVEVSSNEGDLVVDPFMGSGTTAIACRQLNRHYIGFEINPVYIRMARARLKQLPGVEGADRHAA